MATAQVLEMKPKQRAKGDGMLYRRGNIWWMGYYDANGRSVRESTKFRREDWDKAEKLLRKRLAQKDANLLPDKKAEKILVSALADSYLLRYRTMATPDRNADGPDAEFLREKAERLIKGTEHRWNKHLEPFFGNMRAAKVTTDSLNRYVATRQAEEAGNGTVNRELAMLHKIFSLALKHDPPKVSRVPGFPEKLPEPPPHTGFVEDAEYKRLCEKCSEPWMRPFLAVAYTFGFRKGEMLNMRVRQVNLAERTIRLGYGTTKNKQPRLIVMTEEVHRLLSECVNGKSPDDYVFTRSGRRILDFREGWAKLTDAAGLPGLLVHDFRRSAVRNMVRRGVTEDVAMKISGHRTRAIFSRYNITSEADLADAALKIENGYNTVTMSNPQASPAVVNC